MENEVITAPTTNEVSVDFKAKATEYLNSMGTKLPAKHMAQFLEMAQSFQLNPFKREIYAVGYGDNWNLITGFEVYLKRAERTGLLDGWETEESGCVKDGTLKSTITIYRKDRSHPFKHTVFYSEAVNKNKSGEPNSVWSKMPIYMTKKVAMAQGFRLCFPDELAGMPYTSDEMPEIEKPAEKVEKTPAPKKSEPDPYKMTKTQSDLMKQMFSEDIFAEEEINSYRAELLEKKITASDLIDKVTEIYNKRKADITLVSEAFDGATPKQIEEGIF